jgi:hypothetical protein
MQKRWHYQHSAFYQLRGCRRSQLASGNPRGILSRCEVRGAHPSRLRAGGVGIDALEPRSLLSVALTGPYTAFGPRDVTAVAAAETAPMIGTLTLQDGNIASGREIHMELEGASDPDLLVTYYRETNGEAGLQTDDLQPDETVAREVQPTELISLPTNGFAAGVQTFYAQGVNSLGAQSAVTTASKQVYATIVARQVFYNNSGFDGSNGTAASPKDDAAIATDKQVLIGGQNQSPTFANITSYSRGINGVMVDILGLPGTPSAADFNFAVGTLGSGFVTAPAPTSVTVRRGAGTLESDRVTIIWPDGAIKNQWLRTQILSSEATGLPPNAGSQQFFVGNLVGETGDDAIGQQQTIGGLFNTGVDAAGQLLPDNGVDSHYSPSAVGLIQSPSRSTAATDIPSTWVPNDSTSRWITADDSSFVPATSFTYSVRVVVPDDADLNSVVLNGAWAGGGTIIFNSTVVNEAGSGFEALTPFQINADSLAPIIHGLNTLQFTSGKFLRVAQLSGSYRAVPPDGTVVDVAISDEMGARAAAVVARRSLSISNPFDFDRDGKINHKDFRISSSNRGGELTITATPSAGTDVDDQLSEAVPAPFGTTLEFLIESPNDVDMYEVSAFSPGNQSFITVTADVGVTVRVFNEVGSEIAFYDGVTPPGGVFGDNVFSFDATATGHYFVGVSGLGNSEYDAVSGSGDRLASPSSYSLTISETISDTNSTIGTAVGAAIGSTRSESITYSTAFGDIDMYRFYVSSARTVRFDVDSPAGGLDSYLRLFTSAGTVLAVADNANAPGESSASPREAYLSYTFSSVGFRAGYYYIGVSSSANRSYNPLNGTGTTVGGSTGTYTISIL